MTKEQPIKNTNSKPQIFKVMPSEEVILEHFNAFLTEYFVNRSITGIQDYLAPKITSFGTSANEVVTNLEELIAAMKLDLNQVPEPTILSNASFRAERLSDSTAIVWGRTNIQGRSKEISFEISGCRMSAVFTLIDTKLLISHWHISHPQEMPGEQPESWPIRRICADHHETTEKYRIVFDNSPVGIEVFDEKGIIRDCNKKFLSLFGTTLDKVVGMNLFELPDKKLSECIRKALQGHTGYYEGYYSSITTNKITPVKALSTPIFSSDSRITGGISIIEDVSEHRVTQDRLQYKFQLERLVSNIAQSLVSAPLHQIDQVIENALALSGKFFDADRCYIFQVDFSGSTITNTHEWCATDVDSVINKYQAYPLDLLPDVLDFPRRALEYLHFPDVSKMPDEMASFRKLLMEDDILSILLLPLIVQGKFIGLFGYDCVTSSRCWDHEEIMLLKIIGEMLSNALCKKASEKQIRDSEEKYRLVAENVSDVIWIIDLETFKYTYISPSVSTILGYTANEMMLSEITATLTDESADFLFKSVPERLNNLRANQQTRYVDEVKLVCRDGRVIEAELTGNWIFNPVTQHAEVIGITRDITERKAMEEQKRQIEIHRQQSLKADSLGRMAGSIAHHFNNQLQVILGNLELIALDRQNSGIISKNVSDAMRATHKAAEMSTMMLTYLGQHQVDSQTFNLHAVCNSQLATLRKLLPIEHKLELTGSATNVNVKFNREHLIQLLRNVVINSSEAYGENSGTISLSVLSVTSREIPVANRFPPEWVPEYKAYACLKIHDTGRGIAEDDVNKTFDPFFSTKGTGRGLGLANALGFMRSVDGGITMDSQPGHGCTFCYYFPEVDSPVETELHIAKNSIKRAAAKMILVVEDEEMVRFITRSLLENFNYKVVEAADGGKALDILKALKEQIDLVICDLVMPDMDGWQTLEELRKIVPEIPVILASGYDQDFVMRGEHRQHPQAFLMKPYNSTRLQQAIEQALS